jgi:hypothetical protein
MSQESARSPHHRSTGLWVAIVIILIPPVVVPLWVPLYNKTDPTLWGFPFFFWFQFALIIFSAILTATAYGLSLLADRRSGRGEAR